MKTRVAVSLVNRPTALALVDKIMSLHTSAKWSFKPALVSEVICMQRKEVFLLSLC